MAKRIPRDETGRGGLVIDRWLAPLLFVPLYALSGKVFVQAFTPDFTQSLIWPGSGIAIAALLLGGGRFLPAIVLGTAVGEFWLGASPMASLLVGLLIGAEATLLFALLKLGRHFDPRLARLVDLLHLLLAAGLATALGALLAMVVLSHAGLLDTEAAGRLFFRWWMIDVLGVALITPALLVWREMPDWLTGRRLAEAVVIFIATFVAGQIVFLGWFSDFFGSAARGYWMFLFITWVALRLGPQGVALALLLVALQALAGARLGLGFFAHDLEKTQLAAYWGFMLVLTIVGMALATFFSGLSRARAEIAVEREMEASLHRLLAIGLGSEAPDQTLQRMLDHLLALPWLGPSTRAALFVREAGDGHLRLAAHRSLGDEARRECEHLVLGQCLCGQVVLDGKPRFATKEEALRICLSEANGVYALPLVFAGETLGVLGLQLASSIPPNRVQENFLAAAAGAIAGYLARMESERQLVAQQALLETRVRERTAALARSEARLRAILDTMADGMVQIDEDGLILGVNPALCKMFGYAAEELVGRHVDVLLPLRLAHADGEEASSHLLLAGAVATRERHEFLGRRRDGSVFPLEVSVSELADEQGRSLIGVVHDISAHKALEEELRAARHEAERLARVKSEFLANMSHEIRTPLTAILGLAQIGMRENAGRAAYETCERILSSGRHLLAVINDVLDFSKLEAGKLSFERRPLPLPALLDDALSIVALEAKAKGLTISHRLETDLPTWVLGDATRIRQILINLLANAIKFTPSGEIELRVSRKGEEIHFAVRDTGIGMSEEQRARLFRPFEQANGSTTRRYGGSGLGLAISQALAQGMGGHIEVASELGKGSTFTLCLPLPATEVAEEHAGPATQNRQMRLSGMRVLAVEDLEINRLILADLLAHEGAVIEVVADGLTALRRVATDPGAYDLVLMDVQMPEMDGYEACQQLKRLAPDLPVIGLTAHALAEERTKAFAAGMADLVAKPFELDELVAVLSRHLRRQTNAAAVPPAPTSALSSVSEETTAGVEIDREALARRYAGRGKLLGRLAQATLLAHGQDPQRLRELTRAGDLAQIAFLAHAWKSVAGNFAASSLREAAAELEKNARTASPTIDIDSERFASRIATFLAELQNLPLGEETS